MFAKQINLATPHHTTIRQWIIRYGCHTLQTPLEQASDWIAIADLTINIGKLKCLAVLGVRSCDLEKREDLTLSHKEVEVLGLYPTEKSTGVFILESFEDSAKRIGGLFVASIIDQGSDIKMGARLFQEKHPETKILHDISHKLSNIVEHELKNDDMWSKYIQELNMTRKRAYQTEFASLMPKKQRKKARFMDIGYLVQWPGRIKNSKEKGNFKMISEERYHDYLGWLNEFSASLEIWEFIDQTVQFIKKTVRVYGVSLDVYEYIQMCLEKPNIEEERLKNFIAKVLKTVWMEVEKLDEGQCLICSTEVIESIFGKYKSITTGLNGITGSILGICSFVGKEKTELSIKHAMENCSVRDAVTYVRQKFGETITSLRRKFFPPSKKAKFDTEKSTLCEA